MIRIRQHGLDSRQRDVCGQRAEYGGQGGANAPVLIGIQAGQDRDEAFGIGGRERPQRGSPCRRIRVAQQIEKGVVQIRRRRERRTDAAERASVAAAWLGAVPYPAKKIEDAWTLVERGVAASPDERLDRMMAGVDLLEAGRGARDDA